jgi:hypothetical protein
MTDPFYKDHNLTITHAIMLRAILFDDCAYYETSSVVLLSTVVIANGTPCLHEGQPKIWLTTLVAGHRARRESMRVY